MKKMTENYWFTNRDYGYGWKPANKYGWVTIGVYFALALGALSQVDKTITEFAFVLFVCVLTAVLVVISYLTGPKPEWRWGNKDKTGDSQND